MAQKSFTSSEFALMLHYETSQNHCKSLQAYIQNLAENGPVVTDNLNKSKFHMPMSFGQGQEMTLNFNTHISCLTLLVPGHRLQNILNIHIFYFFLKNSLSYKI